MKLKNKLKYVNIILLCLFIILEFLNFLFQGIIYNYYEMKASSDSSEIDYWGLGIQFKNIGVTFSSIADILFYVLLVSIVIWFSLHIFLKLKQKHNNDSWGAASRQLKVSYDTKNADTYVDDAEFGVSSYYTYDENGIRTSKTVNGVTTYYNTMDGIILSQTDGTNTMHFQYDPDGVPLGLNYNGKQYLYMTNQQGDVASIVNSGGKEVVQFCFSIGITLKNQRE